jgi:hypothetical protein
VVVDRPSIHEHAVLASSSAKDPRKLKLMLLFAKAGFMTAVFEVVHGTVGIGLGWPYALPRTTKLVPRLVTMADFAGQ